MFSLGADNVEPQVTEFISRYVKDARLVEDIGKELTYQLPEEDAHTGAFEQLFNNLDKNLLDLGLTGYGISDTTLEEVFLRVAEETGVDEDKNIEFQRQRVEQLTDGNIAISIQVVRYPYWN